MSMIGLVGLADVQGMVTMTLSVGMVDKVRRMAYMVGKVGMARLKCRVSVRGVVGVVG
jgi:hypothetical protein